MRQKTCSRGSSHHSTPGSRKSTEGSRLDVTFTGPMPVVSLVYIWSSEFKSRLHHLWSPDLWAIPNQFSFLLLLIIKLSLKLETTYETSLPKVTETVIIILIAAMAALALNHSSTGYSIALHKLSYVFCFLHFCFFICIITLLYHFWLFLGCLRFSLEIDAKKKYLYLLGLKIRKAKMISNFPHNCILFFFFYSNQEVSLASELVTSLAIWTSYFA